MPHHLEKAARREYRRIWIGSAWRDTLAHQRRHGIWVNSALAAVGGVAAWLLGEGVNLMVLVVGVLAGPLLFLTGSFVVHWWRVPARLAFERQIAEEHGGEAPLDTIKLSTPPSGVGPPIVTFTTNQQPARRLYTEGPVKKLRFFHPVEQVVSREDLPATVPLGRRGRLVVKMFASDGALVEEQGARGIRVMAEVYYRDEPSPA